METSAAVKEMLEGMGGIDNIDPEEEEKRCEALRVLLDKTHEIREKSEKGEECVSDVTDVIQECNKVSKKVRFAGSAYLDAMILLNTSLTLKQCMDTMGSQLNEYKSEEFAGQLVTYQQTCILPKAQNKMQILENWANKCFNSVMCYCSGQKGHMTDVTDVVQKSRTVRRREKLEAVPVKRPQTVKAVTTDKDLPEYYINIIMKALIKRQRETNAPVPLFELITNPHSFSETVENLFYFSHVYKEGLVRPCNDEFGLPLVKAILEKDPPAKKSKKGEGVVARHYVIKMTRALWEKIIKVYKIKESMIPSRGNTAP